MPDKAARALRRFCLDCQGGHVPSVAACADAACLLYPLRRYGLSPDIPEEALPAGQAARQDAPIRVIRRFCLSCAGGRQDVRQCDAREACPLWSFRFGVTPATFKRVLARRRKWQTELFLPLG